MRFDLSDAQVDIILSALDDAFYYRADDADSLSEAGDHEDAESKREQAESYRLLAAHINRLVA